MDELSFTIMGDPKSKGRPRVTRYGAYTPKTTVEAENAIAKVVKGLVGDTPPFQTPCGLEIAFFCKTMRRTDLDNMIKLVSDAMNGIVYTDDYLVEEVRCRLYRKKDGEEPRTEVVVYRLDDEL